MRVFVCTCVVRSDQGGSRKNKKDCSGHRLKRGRLRSLGERTADWKIRHACEGQEVLVNLQVRRSNSHVLKPLSATFLPTTPSLFFRTSASTALWQFVSNYLWYLYTCAHRCIPVVPFKVENNEIKFIACVIHLCCQHHPVSLRTLCYDADDPHDVNIGNGFYFIVFRQEDM